VKDHHRKASQAALASPGEKTRSRRLGKPTPAVKGESRTNWHSMLIALGLLTFALLLALPLLTHLQSRPSTSGVVLEEGPFDGERAFADLRRLVGFGPRPSGSQALEPCRKFIIGEVPNCFLWGGSICPPAYGCRMLSALMVLGVL